MTRVASAKHKLLPVVAERELALLGFELVSRHVPAAAPPARDTFVVRSIARSDRRGTVG